MLCKVRLLPLIAAAAALLWLIFPFGFPTYDTAYALLWGDELAHGARPDYSAPLPPTPHPLADLWGALLSPFGPNAAADATTALAYLALGALGYLVYRLGALWFDRAVGVAAAAIVLTRFSYLSIGLLAYVDLPYLVLTLAALVLETRRPRAGWPVLVLLALAGLLRPEAALFSAAYLAYLLLERDPQRGMLALRRRGGLERPQVIGLVLLAVSAPVAWGLFDLITAGDLTYSFTGTRETVRALHRPTGLVDLVLHGPRLLGEVLEWPAALGAAVGVPLCLAFLTRRSVTGAAALALALAAFAMLAIAGLAIISRYMLLAAALLAIFCAAALFAWRLLDTDHPWRRPWQLFAAALVVLFVIWIPRDFDQLLRAHTDFANRYRVADDLHDLVDSVAFRPACGPISVPNYRAVPWIASWLNLRPRQIVISAEQRQPRRGYLLQAANQFVVHNFLLDPADPHRLVIRVPPRFGLVRANESWKLYARCGGLRVSSVHVPGPGTLSLTGNGLKTQRPGGAAASRAVNAAGTVKPLVKPKGKTKHKLSKKGKAKVKVSVTYTPTGGNAATQSAPSSSSRSSRARPLERERESRGPPGFRRPSSQANDAFPPASMRRSERRSGPPLLPPKARKRA